MNYPENTFTQALKKGQKQIGLWVSLRNNFSAGVVSTSGYDWLLVDMEHTPNDLSTVLTQLDTIANGGSTAIVRPPWNDTVQVKRLLDIGAPGLLFPMIQSVDEAEKAVAATRYPPRGVRGVTGTSRANAFGRIKDYYEQVEAQTAVLIQLETRAAVENAFAIASVDGVTGVFFGPADIAADIGMLGQPLCDEVWDLIMPAAKELMAKGIPVGTLVSDADFAVRLFAQGFSFVACGSDLGLLVSGADNLLASVKEKIS